MNKTNHTLKTAQNDQKGTEPPVAVPLSPEESLNTSSLEMEEEMNSLYHSIDSLLPESEKKVIQFIGSNEGEGTSTIIREFAKVVSEKFGKSVLLLDTDKQKTSQFLFFDIKSGNGAHDSFSESETFENALYQVSEPHLSIKSYSKSQHSTDQASDFMSNDDIWENIRQKFDFILVDSLPATTSSNGLAFSRKMDGIVLVLEAEKTRWQVVDNVKDQIEKHGGKILGVVFNKRKFYIPNFIYKGL